MKSLDIFQNIIKGVALLLWLGIFAIFVQPEVGRVVIPYLVDFSQARAGDGIGIDLEPIRLNADDNSFDNSSALYSKGFGYQRSSIGGDLVTSDTRVIAMSRFLTDYNSPMAPYAEVFVESADNVNLDWRLVASISGVESGFGRITPYQSNNGWGWRGGPGGAFSNFETWEEGIRHVTTRIAIGYGTNITPFTMEAIYCPPCGQVPTHPWANGVTRYMNILEEYEKNL